MNRLLLIDGMAVLYRAFYAIRDLSTRAGQPTNALFGFIRMFRQMVDAWAPTHLAVAFDGGRPEERVALLETYKAQRAPTPDSLKTQIPLAEEFLTRSGVAWVRLPGREADDILASMATQVEREGAEVLIGSSDKDMYQLVTDRVKMVSVAGQQTMMGAEEVRHKTGVSPHQIVHWLALVGDSADNIDGVPGVGPKGAAKLLARFGSIDELWPRLDELAGEKVGQALIENRGVVERNIKLVSLVRDIPMPFTWEQMATRPADAKALLPFFESLDFDAMAGELRQPDLFG